ncbi:hypothetical protein GALMADRAFT_135606 [Galerina marginata CBS 339.88]|uniref:Uncharacterized protein n=1 Tax=Galerina marginata (strain CBS 339.88) TaxID=685588 RepID=A0A067TGF7_GALM3|nr:hypothetical protein GALMADRAFT_135606 [Galerina marginata CBS 339.88]
MRRRGKKSKGSKKEKANEAEKDAHDLDPQATVTVSTRPSTVRARHIPGRELCHDAACRYTSNSLERVDKAEVVKGGVVDELDVAVVDELEPEEMEEELEVDEELKMPGWEQRSATTSLGRRQEGVHREVSISRYPIVFVGVDDVKQQVSPHK